MKNRLHQSITVFMAMLVLLSSTGFGFIEHQCTMRGKSLKFVSEQKANSGQEKLASCCAKSKALKESKGSFFKMTDCCKDSQRFEKLETVSSLSQVIVKLMKATAGDMLWAFTSFTFITTEWVAPDLSVFSPAICFSSLFHGRSMLSFVQSFLI